MAIHDRWYKDARDGDGDRTGKQARTREYGCALRWQVRWRDHAGTQRKKSFARKVDAEQADAKIRAQLADGTYVDQAAGKVPFETYAEQWRATRTHDPVTAERIERAFRRHVYSDPGNPGRSRAGGPALGHHSMRVLAQRPSILQGWIAGMAVHPNTARKYIGDVSQVFAAAIDDGIIARNPLRARSVQKPAAEKTEAVPWTTDQLAAVSAALPARYSVLPLFGAATGLRQGELLGLAVDDIDFLRRVVRVDTQLKQSGTTLVFAPTKNKTVREVPLAAEIVPLLAEHVRKYPPAEVTLPWSRPGGRPVTRRLVFTNTIGAPIWRQRAQRFWTAAWRKAGVPDRGRMNGMHVLRHTAASMWLSGGLNLAKAAAFLGDTNEVVMKVYHHFMPEDDDRARVIMSAFFAPPEAQCAPDVPGVTER